MCTSHTFERLIGTSILTRVATISTRQAPIIVAYVGRHLTQEVPDPENGTTIGFNLPTPCYIPKVPLVTSQENSEQERLHPLCLVRVTYSTQFPEKETRRCVACHTLGMPDNFLQTTKIWGLDALLWSRWRVLLCHQTLLFSQWNWRVQTCFRHRFRWGVSIASSHDAPSAFLLREPGYVCNLRLFQFKP